MAKEQKGRGANRTGSRKKPTMESNKKSKTKNGGRDEPEPESTRIVPISSSDSENDDNSNNNVDHEEQVVEESDDEEEETNQRSNSNRKRGDDDDEDDDDDDDDDDSKTKNSTKKTKTKKKEVSPLYQFPMHRVNRMMKSEDPSIRISQEAVFLINKASEKFLNLFTTEAYAAAFLDRKKYVGYQHLSSVVTKRKRFDFLSDFVPEKMKAEDALKEIPSIEP